MNTLWLNHYAFTHRRVRSATSCYQARAWHMTTPMLTLDAELSGPLCVFSTFAILSNRPLRAFTVHIEQSEWQVSCLACLELILKLREDHPSNFIVFDASLDVLTTLRAP